MAKSEWHGRAVDSVVGSLYVMLPRAKHAAAPQAQYFRVPFLGRAGTNLEGDEEVRAACALQNISAGRTPSCWMGGGNLF